MPVLPVASIIVPAYNESSTISQVLSNLEEISLIHNYEVIVIDDASTDETHAKMIDYKSFKVLKNEKNLGKTQSISNCMDHVTSNVIVIQDADLEYPVSNIPIILETLNRSGADACYGTRPIKDQFFYPTVLGRFLTSGLINLFFGSHIKDINTGHKVFKKSSLEGHKFETGGFGFCAELTMKLLSQKMVIKEVDIDYFPRQKKDGKKISFFDGINIFMDIITFKIKSVLR